MFAVNAMYKTAKVRN